MKKLILLSALVLSAAALQAGECRWSWWVDGPDTNKEIHGCQLGIASEAKEIHGAQVSLLWGRLNALRGGCQFACGYTNVKKLTNGCQVSFVNIARDGAALQIGLLNWNPKGFLPFFPFFNFSTQCFGNK